MFLFIIIIVFFHYSFKTQIKKDYLTYAIVKAFIFKKRTNDDDKTVCIFMMAMKFKEEKKKQAKKERKKEREKALSI